MQSFFDSFTIYVDGIPISGSCGASSCKRAAVLTCYVLETVHRASERYHAALPCRVACEVTGWS